MASLHMQGSILYPIEDFKTGKAGRKPNIPDDLGSVQDKSILHLQCHIGLDSLMWACNGAKVTGVDFSSVAILEAKKLNGELGLDAKFLESDLSTLPERLTGQFDIVLTYFGTITWLPDLKRWGEVVAHFVRPGGFFYISDTHPIAMCHEVSKGDDRPRLAYKYFAQGEPMHFKSEGGTYANPDASREHNLTYEWQHTLEDVVCSLVDAGLHIDYLHEFPYCFYDLFFENKKSIMERVRMAGGE